MPEKYIHLLTKWGVPMATTPLSGGGRRNILDWNKMMFPLTVAVVMAFGGAAYNQSNLNGKVVNTLDNVAAALRDVSTTNQQLQTAVTTNTTVISSLQDLPKVVHKLETEVAVIKSKEEKEK